MAPLPQNYTIRTCRRDEVDRWKTFPFDTEKDAQKYEDFMSEYVDRVYGDRLQEFLDNTFLLCREDGEPIATCSYWKAYDRFFTIQWFKTVKQYEGRGLGRALLSHVMDEFALGDYPIYLHTQPGSFRAIKLYSDFGFSLLSGDRLGSRKNDLSESLAILQDFMHSEGHKKLEIVEPDPVIIDMLSNERSPHF